METRTEEKMAKASSHFSMEVILGTFGGGREENSHPLSPNLKVELGVPSLFKEGRDGEESCKVHVLTVRDGSCRGLCQVASQRGLTKIRMESSGVGWIRWVEGMVAES